MRECSYCHQQFDPVNDRPPHRISKYCSRECSGLARRNRVDLVCRQCSQPFQRKAYMADWSQDRGPFCGFECYGQWQSENTRGADNPGYLPDNTSRYSRQLQEHRAIVLELAGHKCVQCGSDYRLHVHHIREWNPDDPTTHALDNLMTLCASCHRKQHPIPHRPDGKFSSRQ